MAYRNWWRSCQDEVFSCENLFFVWAIRPWVVLLFVKQWYQGLKMWKKSPNISFASKISFAKPFHTGLAKISAQHEHFPLVVCLNLAWPREATEWYQFSWWTRPFSDCRDPQILISIHPMCPAPSNLSSLWSQNRSLVSGLPFRWFATNISTFISLIRYDKPRSYSKSKNKKSAWPTFILFFLLNPGEVWISIQTKAPWALFWRFGHWEKNRHRTFGATTAGASSKSVSLSSSTSPRWMGTGCKSRAGGTTPITWPRHLGKKPKWIGIESTINHGMWGPLVMLVG